jgi:membrane protein DedA with SNARE-associated domain
MESQVNGGSRFNRRSYWITALLLIAAIAGLVWFSNNYELSMSPELLLKKYGYAAIAAGTFMEGETILAIAGFLAAEHYLKAPFMLLAGFLGAFIGHLFWFWLGRTQGHKILDRFPKLLHALDRVIGLLDRYGPASIFISQYVYGFRLTAAIMFGLSHIRTSRFIFWQAINCAIWTLLIAGLGFYFGKAVQRVLGQAAEVEKIGLGVIVAIGIAIFVYHKIRERRKKRAAAVEES